MAEDRWYTVALPLLEYFSTLPPHSMPTIGQLAEVLDMDPMVLVDEIDRLAGAGYIRGGVHKMMTGGNPTPWFVDQTGLEERGARAVGMWPCEDPYDALLAIIEDAEAGEPDEDRRSRLRKFRDSLQDVGKSVATALLVEWAKGTIRF